MGPATPIVARIRGQDVRATSPLQVVRTSSRFGLTSWHAEAQAGDQRLTVEVDAPRASLVGVTYHDPDGTPAYCYNSEVASLRLHVWDRTARGRFGWTLRETLQSPGARPLRGRPARAPRGRGAAGPLTLLAAPFTWAGEHLAIELPGGRALFTTRRGGVSERPVRLAEPRPLTDDDPAAVARTTGASPPSSGSAPGRSRRSARSTAARCCERDAGGARRRGGRRPRGTAARDRRRSSSPPTACRSRSWRPGGGGDGPRGLARARRRACSRHGVAALARRAGRSARRSDPARAPAATRSGPEVHERFGIRRGRTQHRPQGDRARAAARRRRRARSTTPGCARLRRARPAAFFSHRRDARPHRAAGGGRVAELIRGLDPDRVPRAPGARCGAERRRPASRSLAAVKYVADRGARRPRRGGRQLVGENRAQDAAGEGRRLRRRCFTWDFIGHAAEPQGQADPAARAPDPLASAPTASLAQLARHADRRHDRDPRRGQRRPRAGQERRGPRRARRLHRALSPAARASAGLMTMPPLASDAEDSRRWFAALARARGRARPARGCRWAPSQDYAVAAQEGATIVRIGTKSLSARAGLVQETALDGLTLHQAWPSATPGTARSSTSASPRSAT